MPLLRFQNIDFLYNAPYRMRLKNWGPGWRLEGPRTREMRVLGPPNTYQCIEIAQKLKVEIPSSWTLKIFDIFLKLSFMHWKFFVRNLKVVGERHFSGNKFFCFWDRKVVLMQRIQSNKYTVIQLCAICFYLFLF